MYLMIFFRPRPHFLVQTGYVKARSELATLVVFTPETPWEVSLAHRAILQTAHVQRNRPTYYVDVIASKRIRRFDSSDRWYGR